MKVLFGSLNQDLISEVQSRWSKCLGLWQYIRGLWWPWYNQDETSIHSLTIQGSEIRNTSWSCPDSCARCSWSSRLHRKQCMMWWRRRYFYQFGGVRNELPSPWAVRVQMVTVSFGGQSLADANLQWTGSVNKIRHACRKVAEHVLGLSNKKFSCRLNRSLKEGTVESYCNIVGKKIPPTNHNRWNKTKRKHKQTPLQNFSKPKATNSRRLVEI